MRPRLAACCLLPFLFACQIPTATADTKEPPAPPAELQAGEEFSMQQYWFGMIYRGPKYFDKLPAEESQAIQAAHLGRIGELSQTGQMALAGPFDADPEAENPFIGLFLYDVATREEAEALAASDPAVQAGRLRVEVFPWYGASGLTFPGDPSP